MDHATLLRQLAGVLEIDARDVYRTGRELTAVMLLRDAGYHAGQVDDDGMHAPPPHDDNCRVCAITDGGAA
jgi:hypothetical protein